jgi:hypothetical protein
VAERGAGKRRRRMGSVVEGERRSSAREMERGRGAGAVRCAERMGLSSGAERRMMARADRRPVVWPVAQAMMGSAGFTRTYPSPVAEDSDILSPKGRGGGGSR